MSNREMSRWLRQAREGDAGAAQRLLCAARRSGDDHARCVALLALPGEASWAELCEVLPRIDVAGLAAEAWVRERLRDPFWVTLRRAPRSWLAPLCDAAPPATMLGCWAFVDQLDAWFTLDPEGLRRIIARPTLTGLSALWTPLSNDGDLLVDALASSPHAETLRVIDFEHSRLGPAALARLFDGETFPVLRHLALEDQPGLTEALEPQRVSLTKTLRVNRATELTIAALSHRLILPLLRRLTLVCEPSETLAQLATERSTTAVEVDCRFHSPSQLAHAKWLRAVARATVRVPMLSTPWARSLARGRHLETIRALQVADASPVPRTGLVNWTAVTRAAHLARLERLEVRWLALPRGATRALARAVFAKRLQRLRLSRCRLGDEDVVDLIDETELSALWRLDLSCNALGDRAVEALVESTLRPSMLDLSDNRIGERGLEALARWRHPGLQWLGLRGNAFDPQRARELLSHLQQVALDDHAAQMP